MWRDRTNLYISYRQSYAHHPTKKSRFSPTSGAPNGTSYSDNVLPEEQRGLISSNDNDALIEMDVLPPRWLDIQEEVIDTLDEINKKIPKLESLHSKHVLPGFEDDSVKKREEREIERMTQEMTRGFQQCQGAIRRVGSMVKDTKQKGDMSKAEETMAKNLQMSLATKVGEVSATFRKKQSSYLKKLRALSGMASPTDGTSTPIQTQGSGNPYNDPSLMESDADRSFSQSTLQQTALKRQRKGNDPAILQREQEIDQIAKGIIDLASIFQELNTMVIDQGTVLDRIDYNVERMATDVKAADKELTVATGYQKRTTKRKIILLLILIVVGMFILLLVKPKKRDRPPEPPPPPAPPPLRERSPPP